MKSYLESLGGLFHFFVALTFQLFKLTRVTIDRFIPQRKVSIDRFAFEHTFFFAETDLIFGGHIGGAIDKGLDG